MRIYFRPVGKMERRFPQGPPLSSPMPRDTFEQGASAYEKRGVAVSVPDVESRKVGYSATSARTSARLRRCVPRHDRGGSRPAPKAMKSAPVKLARARAFTPTPCRIPAGLHGLRRVCVGVCPTKSLEMVPQEKEAAQQECVRLRCCEHLRQRGYD
jgi:pyruvate-ferredoxin/flavodoxin oxidoreductase